MSSLDVFINPALIDITHQYDGMNPEGYSEDELFAAGATRFPDYLRIPRKDWDEWINNNDKNRTAPINYSARYTHQGNSHECVCHATTQSFEIAYNRQFASTKYAVYGSPLALYTRITGGRQWGGSNVMDALREMMANGMIPEYDGAEWMGGKLGQYKHFKHTVHQTSGRSESHWPTKGWITPSRLPEGWKQTARHFRVLEAWTIPDAEAHASALLRGLCVVNGRQGHSIPHVQLVKSNGRYYSKYRDSYNEDRYDSESLWGGGFAIVSVTIPQERENPAGHDMKEPVVVNTRV
jgi:hypothetical protein